MILTLPFLEQRAYLHGTTLLDALLERIPTESSISFKVPHMIRSDRICLTSLAQAPALTNDYDATLVWHKDEKSGWIGVKMETPSEKIDRTPFAEEQVVEKATFLENRVEYNFNSPFTFIATLVALHKALLLRNKIADGPGQWVFTRLDLSRTPQKFQRVAIEIERILGKQLAKSTISVNEATAGTIYFSWLPAK